MKQWSRISIYIIKITRKETGLSWREQTITIVPARGVPQHFHMNRLTQKLNQTCSLELDSPRSKKVESFQEMLPGQMNNVASIRLLKMIYYMKMKAKNGQSSDLVVAVVDVVFTLLREPMKYFCKVGFY